MLSSLPSPASKSARLYRPVITVVQRFAHFMKPVCPAAAAMLLIAILISVVFFKPGTETTYTGMVPGADQNKVHLFTHTLINQYSATANETNAGTYITVRLSANLLYRLQRETTYQELVTTNEKLLPFLTRRLDAQGIEYEVLKNKGGTGLLAKKEWIISWGGILYVPQPDVSF